MKVITILLATGLATSAAFATGTVQSGFSSGDDAWTLIDWNGAGTPSAPSWYSTGGNPGGYIRSGDVFGDGFFNAPAAFKGDLSGEYGQTLSYDSFTLYSDWQMNDIYIEGNGQTLTYWWGTNPGSTWTSFAVKLDDTAGWRYGLEYDTHSNPLATEAQIRSVLSDVTSLRIRQEFHWGGDDTGLDNVTLGTVGVPDAASSLGLLGFALGGLAMMKRRIKG